MSNKTLDLNRLELNRITMVYAEFKDEIYIGCRVSKGLYGILKKHQQKSYPTMSDMFRKALEKELRK